MEEKAIENLKALDKSYADRLSKLNAMADESLEEGISSYIASQKKTLEYAEKAEVEVGEAALTLSSTSLKKTDSQANEAILKSYLTYGVKGVKDGKKEK
jgi:hypothetical protein